MDPAVNHLPSRSSAPRTLAERLRTLLEGRDDIDIAKFQFIGLEEVKHAYGERWPEKRSRIQEMARTFLANRLNPSDVLIPGAEGFVVAFAEANAFTAQAVAYGLAHSLNEFMLGQAASEPALRTRADSARVNAEAFKQSVGDIEFQDAPPPAPLTQELAIDWRYQPVWDVRREALSSYYVVPIDRRTQDRVPGYQFEPEGLRPSPFAEIDEQALRHSEPALKTLFAEGKKALLGVSVHVQSVSSVDARSRLISVLQQFDPGLLKYRLLKIAGIPPGFPRIYLHEITSIMKRWIPNVVLGASLDEQDFATLLGPNIVAAGCSIPAAARGGGSQVSQAEMLSRIRALAQATHAARLQFYVEGQVDPQMAMRLSAMGIDSLSSGLIWRPQEKPDGMVRWTADRLLQSKS